MRRIVTTLLVTGLIATVFASSAPAQTTTTAPPTYAQALEARLAKEWNDPPLAKEIVTAMSPETLASFEAKVPQAQVATAPFLAYRPKPIPAKNVDSLIVYTFGNRVDANGTITAGPTNEELARVTKAFLAKHKVPVYAQEHVAQFLEAAGVPNVTTISPVVGPDGNLVYLSTAGVVQQVEDKATAAGVDLGTVGVLCFADHAGRCLLTTEKAGLTAGIPKGVTLPSTYDPQSGQSWTRDRKTYLQTDLAGRLVTL